MSVLGYLPLLLAAAVAAVALATPHVEPWDRAFTRISLDLFRGPIERWGRKRAERTQQLQAVHATTSYAVYASRTLLFGLVGGVVATVAGAYAGFAALSWLLAHAAAVRAALPDQLHFVIETAPSANPIGSLAGGGGAGGMAIPLDVPGWVVDLLPVWIVQAGGWLARWVPRSFGSSGGAGSGGSAPASEVEILVRFPELGVVPPRLTALSPVQLALLLLAAVVVGAAGAAAVAWFRWYAVRNRARNREILIDESFIRTVAFVYALSRSGMLFPEIMRTVSRNRRAFGETAQEVSVAVKQMDLFGADVITALNRTAAWTPSDQFAEFFTNFTDVLLSGQNVPDYLHNQYEQAQRERIEHQEQLLEYFTALGEGYVAILVAGPLFLVTILTIFGILTGGQYVLLQLMIYLAMPAANLGFVAYLGSIGQTMATTADYGRRSHDRHATAAPHVEPGSAVADGGFAAGEENLRRLRLYDRVRPVRWALQYPVETLTARPTVALYLTVPVAVASVLVRWWLHGFGAVLATTLDDWLIQATLLVVVSFAIVQEVHTRRLRRIEAAVPDFLDSLASTNEAGRTFTESLRRLDADDFGVLGEEFERLLVDIEWGARTEDALDWFSDRIGSPTVDRVVALLTNALRASDQIGPVIRIAAEEARKDRSLKRKRRQEMFMYVLIVYISFAVFIGITFALKTVLVPAVPSAEQLGSLAGGGALGVNVAVEGSSGGRKDQYTLLLFHAAAVQGLVSGLVAGKMGEGSVRNGAKHAAILLGGAYVLFSLLG